MGPRTTRSATRHIRLSYDFQPAAQAGPALAHPLFDLLQALRDHGSILRAAKALGVSYRGLWGALKKWEQELGAPLVDWVQGQPARLTPLADRLLWAELRARVRMTPHLEAIRAELRRVIDESLGGGGPRLTVFASHDMALPLLQDLARDKRGLQTELRFCGSVDALDALAAGRCTIAGFHVPIAASQASPFALAMRERLKPGQHKLIACLRRQQGLMVPRGNPAGVAGLADVARLGLRLVNRQPGSGTRLLMEHLRAEAGLPPQAITGWAAPPEDSHLAVAAVVASGMADVAPGVQAAAQAFGLDFVPLAEEDYFLVCLKAALGQPAVAAVRELLAGAEWPRRVATLPGYAPAPRCGEVLSLTRALPWWRFPEGPRRGRAASHVLAGS